MKIVNKIHKFEATLHENYFVPPHEPRTPSPEYEALRHHLVVELDTPCNICGVRQSTLNEPNLNEIKATALELHHKVVEWSWHTVADKNKIGVDYPQVLNMTDSQFLDWLDHSPDIALILCDVHHRHRDLGIHEISDPSFNLVKYLRDDFTLVGI